MSSNPTPGETPETAHDEVTPPRRRGASRQTDGYTYPVPGAAQRRANRAQGEDTTADEDPQPAKAHPRQSRLPDPIPVFESTDSEEQPTHTGDETAQPRQDWDRQSRHAQSISTSADIEKTTGSVGTTQGAAPQRGGALKNAAKNQIKKHVKRRIAVPVAIVTAFILIFVGSTMNYGQMQDAGQKASSSEESNESLSVQAASQDVGSNEDMQTIQMAAKQTGLDWQILAAAKQINSAPGAIGGVGPYNIDKKYVEGYEEADLRGSNDTGAAPEDGSDEESTDGSASPSAEAPQDQASASPASTSGGATIRLAADQKTDEPKKDEKPAELPALDIPKISREDAISLARSSLYIATQMRNSYQGTVGNLENSLIDAGAVENNTDPEKRSRNIGEDDVSKSVHETAKAAYIASLKRLPTEGADNTADAVYSTALAWKLGQKCSASGTTTAGGGVASTVGTSSASLNKQQLTYAQTVINRVAERNMPQTAAVIALAVIAQESTFRMYWNPKVPGSKELANGGPMGTDHHSVGLYQQQVNGNKFSWGDVNTAMDPVKSTDSFLNALEKIKGWESMPVTRAAQKVQVSAFPDAYAKHQPLAEQLVKDLPPTNGDGYTDDEHTGIHPTSAASPSDGTSAVQRALLDNEGESTSIQLAADIDFGDGEFGPSKGANPHKLKVDTSLKPDNQLVQQAVVAGFGEYINAMGGYRPGSKGHEGRVASDLMVVNYKSKEGVEAGNQLAQFFLDNRKAFGIYYIIWQDKIWLGPEKGWEPYSKSGKYGQQFAGNWTDTTLHYDHLHVETYGNQGTGGKVTFDGKSIELGASASGGATSLAGPCGGNLSQTGGVDGIASGETGEGDDYPYSLPGDVSWKAGSKDPGADPWGFYKRECVSFVAWRLNQQMGTPQAPYAFSKPKMGFGPGNATYWGATLKAKGYNVDMTPAVGAVAWWKGGGTPKFRVYDAGHVAIVKEILPDGRVLFEQYNGGTVASNPKKASYSTFIGDADIVNGYIHVADVPTSGKPADA